MARAKQRPRSEKARTQAFWASPAYQRRRNTPGSYQDVDVVEPTWGSLGKSNYMMSPSYQRAARNRPNTDTGVRYPPPKGKVPGNIHNAQTKSIQGMSKVVKGTTTPAARPPAKKKAIASTPAQAHARQIAR